MKGKLKKLVATFVATVMAFTAMPFAVNAEEQLGESKVFNFDVKSCGWEESAAGGIFCHIYSLDGTGSYPGWQSKAERCKYDPSTGIATYDIATGIKKGYTDLETIDKRKSWAVIFNTKSGNETYPVVLNSECYGDTVYAPDSNIYYENPVDSEKKTVMVKWKESDLGAELCITTSGKVQGETIPYGKTKEIIFADYLVNNWDRDIIDTVAQKIVTELRVEPEAVMSEVEKLTNDQNTIKAVKSVLNKCYLPSVPLKDKILSFDMNSFGWDEYAKSGNVYCHIYRADGLGVPPSWQSKIEKCEYNPETGIATYDLNSAIEQGYTELEKMNYKNEWLIILSVHTSSEYAGVNYQSFPAVVNAFCYGDTLYAPDPQDGYFGYAIDGTDLIYAEWKNNSNLGAPKHSKSLYEIAGKTYIDGDTKENVLARHAISYSDNDNLRDALQLYIDEYFVSPNDVINSMYDEADKYAIDNGLDEDTVYEMCLDAEYVLIACIDPTIYIGYKVFYIDVNSLGWDCPDDDEFYCHIYKLDDTAKTPDFMSYAQKCEYDPETGIAKYSIKNALNLGQYDLDEISGANEWSMIFYSKSGYMTYDIFVTSDCYGDTLYAPDSNEIYPLVGHEPTDDPQLAGFVIVEWTNSNAGTPLSVTSEGEIYGWDTAYGETYESTLAQYLIVYAVLEVEFIDDTEIMQSIIDELYVSPTDVFASVEENLELFITEGVVTPEEIKDIHDKIENILSNCEDPTKYVIGDIDGDGELKIQDVTMLQRYLAEVIELDDTQLSNADADFNDNVNVQDVTTMQRIIAEVI
ncbi:MAG: dockerin type I repeat-containing protein [Ruminococcus sp.]|nr:dockerin type I repeat-containing protein [Ruminococcus sp.]